MNHWIIGHELALANGLTKRLLATAQRYHEWKDPKPCSRGYSFDLALNDPDGKPTGIQARVTVEILPREPVPDPVVVAAHGDQRSWKRGTENHGVCGNNARAAWRILAPRPNGAVS